MLNRQDIQNAIRRCFGKLSGIIHYQIADLLSFTFAENVPSVIDKFLQNELYSATTFDKLVKDSSTHAYSVRGGSCPYVIVSACGNHTDETLPSVTANLDEWSVCDYDADGKSYQGFYFGEHGTYVGSTNRVWCKMYMCEAKKVTFSKTNAREKKSVTLSKGKFYDNSFVIGAASGSHTIYSNTDVYVTHDYMEYIAKTDASTPCIFVQNLLTSAVVVKNEYVDVSKYALVLLASRDITENEIRYMHANGSSTSLLNELLTSDTSGLNWFRDNYWMSIYDELCVGTLDKPYENGFLPKGLSFLDSRLYPVTYVGGKTYSYDEEVSRFAEYVNGEETIEKDAVSDSREEVLRYLNSLIDATRFKGTVLYDIVDYYERVPRLALLEKPLGYSEAEERIILTSFYAKYTTYKGQKWIINQSDVLRNRMNMSVSATNKVSIVLYVDWTDPLGRDTFTIRNLIQQILNNKFGNRLCLSNNSGVMTLTTDDFKSEIERVLGIEVHDIFITQGGGSKLKMLPIEMATYYNNGYIYSCYYKVSNVLKM